MHIASIIYPDTKRGITDLFKLNSDQTAIIFGYKSNTEVLEKKVSNYLAKVLKDYEAEIIIGDTHIIVPTKKHFRIIQHLRTEAHILPSDSVDIVDAAHREIEANKKKRA